MLPLRTPLNWTLGFLAVAIVGSAQPAPRPLAHSDFDAWRSIATPQLSSDGRWLAYSFMPQDGDGDLIAREVATGREHRVPVGSIPRPTAAPAEENANPEAPPPLRNIRLAFTNDGQFLVATTHPAKGDIAAAKQAKKKPEEMPKGGLVILSLATGAVTRVADVKSFQVPAKGGAWVAYLKEAKPEEKKPDPAAATTAAPPPDQDPEEFEPAADEAEAEDAAAPRRATTAPANTAAAPGERTFGTELVLRDLAAGSERSFAHVTDYSLARDGRTLLFIVSARTPTENGVYRATPGNDAAPVTLLAGRGRFSRLTWDREQTQAVFVSDTESQGPGTGSGAASRTPARYKVYLWDRGTSAAVAVVSAETKGLPATLAVSSNASASFSRDGKKLYVPVASASRAARPATPAGGAAADDDKVTADLWHWRDGYVQPMQKVRATQDRNRTYRGALDLATMSYVQLADATMTTISTSDDGRRVIGYDDRAYRSLVDYDGRYTDVHLVDATTGARKPAITKLRSEGGTALLWSPDGKWAAYYQGKHWHVLDTATGESRSLTAKVRAAFHNEQDDRPQPPSPYGAAGWTKDSASFVAYERHDVWQLFPDGRPARNLTAGYGRGTKVQLRVQRIDPIDEDDDERGLDPAKPLILRGESEETRASGFFRTTFTATTAPESLLWDDKNHRYLGRARDADALMITTTRFDEFPDVQVTDSSFAKPRKLTDGGAQLAAFTWGRSELMSFRSTDGVPLQASLYTPANFDPKKKYPVIIYLYERLSQNVHNFTNPAPGTSINVPFYVSNGYCVLMPDIVYRTGRPGQSALRCVLPALDAIVARGFVDEKAVGIQGHSWGGYQIAYMITQTNRFRAAEAGAPVGNMTSAYSGIRWGTGLPRQFQYETGQSRIGRPLQSDTKAFLANSPVFHVEKVQTPLLILHNDADDAVPWYQGIELFLALRRHGKEAWLFNYNGEFHGLRRRPNQKDWSKRMSQFFDHFLKGAPAPEWLEKGIPYIERDEEKMKFNAKPAAVAQ
ncbi:MAG: S9 family peptidase [Opitutaceae bacterium]|nr:S9 family peptidase [Opitutaceae bacterium]